jgi:uncharacterized protein (DUF433 family)
MDWRTRIVSNPDILLGKPAVKGTRISVELILGGFASGWSFKDIVAAYPHLTGEDIVAALAYASHVASARQIIDGLPGQDISPDGTLHFVVATAAGGGYVARAIEADIFTESDDLDSLEARILDAVNCHFEPGLAPAIAIRSTSTEVSETP